MQKLPSNFYLVPGWPRFARNGQLFSALMIELELELELDYRKTEFPEISPPVRTPGTPERPNARTPERLNAERRTPERPNA
jgi:hypothetical protein